MTEITDQATKKPTRKPRAPRQPASTPTADRQPTERPQQPQRVVPAHLVAEAPVFAETLGCRDWGAEVDRVAAKTAPAVFDRDRITELDVHVVTDASPAATYPAVDLLARLAHTAPCGAR